MSGRVSADAKIGGGIDQTPPEIFLPQTIYCDAGSEGVFPRYQPAGQSQTVGMRVLRQRVQHGESSGLNLASGSLIVAESQKMRAGRLRMLPEGRRFAQCGVLFPELAKLAGQLIEFHCLVLLSAEHFAVLLDKEIRESVLLLLGALRRRRLKDDLPFVYLRSQQGPGIVVGSVHSGMRGGLQGFLFPGRLQFRYFEFRQQLAAFPVILGFALQKEAQFTSLRNLDVQFPGHVEKRRELIKLLLADRIVLVIMTSGTAQSQSEPYCSQGAGRGRSPARPGTLQDQHLPRGW